MPQMIGLKWLCYLSVLGASEVSIGLPWLFLSKENEIFPSSTGGTVTREQNLALASLFDSVLCIYLEGLFSC